jgi:beta-galactosidase/beta-glucuronidase
MPRTEHAPFRHPQPQLQRESWIALDGPWDFGWETETRSADESERRWTHQIHVPFAPEAPASGIGYTGYIRTCWYRRHFELSPHRSEERVLLHFGAVDYTARVWVNGQFVGEHEGGYTPFSFDITDSLIEGSRQEIVVRADDDPTDLTKPRGKQDWQVEPHAIWYVRTTGIWQMVWLEMVPATRIERLRWTWSSKRWEIGVDVTVAGDVAPGLRLRVELSCDSQVLADDTYSVLGSDVHRRIALADPGIDDYRNELLWTPETPRLIDATLTLVDADGTVLDLVSSYTALRDIGIDGDRLLLNGRPYPLRLVLDQGYWPETGLTAPSDDALRLDVLLAKAMGFNGVRKHQKIEDPRYLFWADQLGLLVWEEMPSAYRFTARTIERVTREWMEVIRRDASHPCVIMWVPFNESWGVPNLPSNEAEQHFVQTLYHLTKTLDPSRPVVGNDGWESVSTDVIGIHDYEADIARLARRYHADEGRPRLFRHERPAGRLLVFDRPSHAELPIVLSEFGGLALMDASSATWGYTCCETTEELAERYQALLELVRSLGMLAGFCYTQFADTYQEANGLLRADRTPKFDLELIALATCGSRAPASRFAEHMSHRT